MSFGNPFPARDDNSFQSGAQGRKYVGVKFNCCGVYTRIYVNKDGTAYEGRCPKCYRPVRLKIGPGGTNQRIFEAD